METRWMGRIELKKEENLNKREQTGGKLLKRLVGDGQKEAIGKEIIYQKERKGRRRRRRKSQTWSKLGFHAKALIILLCH